MIMIPLILLMLIPCRSIAGPLITAGRNRLPDAKLNVRLAAPVNTWDEAVPLGNGLMGGLLWGGGNTIRLSLDRGDLWDERPAVGIQTNQFNWQEIKRLVAGGKASEANAILDFPYNQAHPTKLPGGRLEITLPPSVKITGFELNLAAAEGYAWLEDGRKVEALFSADQPVAIIRLPGKIEKRRLTTPFDGAGNESAGPSSHAAKALNYKAAEFSEEKDLYWYVQEAALGFKYCVCTAQKSAEDSTTMAVAITATTDGEDFVELARKRARKAVERGYDKLAKPHRRWWAEFWAKSSVSLPAGELAILRHYYLVRYFYGSASRLHAPPMPLQGVWTADNGGLPPWKGDYHNDLNTQMTYIGYHGAGNFDEGLSFYDYLWRLLPEWRRFARDFYRAPGAAIPGVMTLAGQPLGGWGMYSLSPTMGAWNAHGFYLHWLYTGDRDYLEKRAYPFCSEIGDCLLSLLAADAEGRLVLPLSSSPEIFDNTGKAWLTPNSNYDIACMKMLFLGLTEMAAACGKQGETEKWKKAAAGLGDFYVNEKNVLRLNRDTDLTVSHRHLSNVIGLFPFNLMTVEGGQREKDVIKATLESWDRLGTGAWCGYSFSWMSCLRSRIGDAENAARNLDIFVNAFTLRNGFHANGDQTGSGYSKFTYRPFTLEGNFLGMQAVHEMLLQSWSPTPGLPGGGVIRIFPAMPWRMHEAEFADLRAEGGHRVSARRSNNATVWFKITAGAPGTVRIRDNFGGRPMKWSREAQKVGDNFEVQLKRGQSVEATIEQAARLPDAPDNAAKPLNIASPAQPVKEK